MRPRNRMHPFSWVTAVKVVMKRPVWRLALDLGLGFIFSFLAEQLFGAKRKKDRLHCLFVNREREIRASPSAKTERNLTLRFHIRCFVQVLHSVEMTKSIT